MSLRFLSLTQRVRAVSSSTSCQRVGSGNVVAVRCFSSSGKKFEFPGPIVTSQWVVNNFPNVRVVDASWYTPSMLEDARGNYVNRRIPGAVFFDIDAISNKETDLPHMMPKPQEFSKIIGEQLGITENDNIVVYDSKGVFSSPRVWFTFRAFGAKNVAILAGGLPQWRREGFPLLGGPSVQQWPAKTFNAVLNKDLVKNFDDMMKNVETKNAVVIDARSAGRFEGVEPEPRPGLRHGHIPNSYNVPWNTLLDDFTGLMKPTPVLRSVFERNGIDLSDKNALKIATCGSGVTACMVVLALNLLGHNKVAIYDGSWAEWGSRSQAPVVTGRRQ